MERQPTPKILRRSPHILNPKLARPGSVIHPVPQPPPIRHPLLLAVPIPVIPVPSPHAHFRIPIQHHHKINWLPWYQACRVTRTEGENSTGEIASPGRGGMWQLDQLQRYCYGLWQVWGSMTRPIGPGISTILWRSRCRGRAGLTVLRNWGIVSAWLHSGISPTDIRNIPSISTTVVDWSPARRTSRENNR